MVNSLSFDSPVNDISTGEKAVESIKKATGMQAKYIDKSRDQVKSEASNRDYAAKFAFFLGGLAAATAGIIKLGVISAVAVSMATPVGWAALGLVAIGIGILAYRHYCMKQEGLETDTGKRLAEGIALGAGATVVGFGLALYCLKMGDLVDAIIKGGEVSIKWLLNTYLMIKLAEFISQVGASICGAAMAVSTINKEGFVDDPHQKFIYQGDHVKIEDGNVNISQFKKPPLEQQLAATQKHFELLQQLT